jgi:integrase
MGISITNPFGGVYFDRQAGVQEREPLPVEAILVIQNECQRHDDELRWLVALISDTGMRLAEATGLTRDDLIIDADHPKVVIREHPWRRLKTASSAREVPLVGKALWAAKRIHSASTKSKYAFPRYNRSSHTSSLISEKRLIDATKGIAP